MMHRKVSRSQLPLFGNWVSTLKIGRKVSNQKKHKNPIEKIHHCAGKVVKNQLIGIVFVNKGAEL
jgi:hypothetical protein